MALAESIKQEALELGFDLAGITDAGPLDAEQIDYFAEWLEKGCPKQLGYMRRNLEKRVNPTKLLKDAKSVICTALNYRPKSVCDTSAPAA